MSPAQIPGKPSSEFSKREKHNPLMDDRKSPPPGQKTEAAVKEEISHAFRKDDVLRAIEARLV
jgi:hypothetical protein